MNASPRVLDCTFRDGGYYTDWDFERGVVQSYLDAIDRAGVDFVEIGFRGPASAGRSMGPFAHCPDWFLREFDLPVPADRLRATPRGLSVSGMLVGTGAEYGMPEDILAIHNVEDSSAADDAELRNMDEIVAMAGKAVSSLEALRALLEARRDQVVEVIVRRRNSRNEAYMRVLRLEVGEVEQVGDWR